MDYLTAAIYYFRFLAGCLMVAGAWLVIYGYSNKSDYAVKTQNLGLMLMAFGLFVNTIGR